MAELSQLNLLTLPRNLLMFQLPLCPFQSLSVCLGDVLQYVCLRRHGLKMLILVLPQIALMLLVAVIRNARSCSFACTLTLGGNALPHHATFFPPQTHLHSTMNAHTHTHTHKHTHRRYCGPILRCRPTSWWSDGQIAGQREERFKLQGLILKHVSTHILMFVRMPMKTEAKT